MAEPAPLNLKIVTKSEPVGYESSNFQGFHISLISNFGENFKKIRNMRVTCPGWFDMELPICDIEVQYLCIFHLQKYIFVDYICDIWKILCWFSYFSFLPFYYCISGAPKTHSHYLKTHPHYLKWNIITITRSFNFLFWLFF